MSKLFQREYDFLLNTFAYPKVEWFYVDVSEQDYSPVYDEYSGGVIKLIKQGNIRGILINDAAKVVAAYGEGNQDNYPFARLEQAVLFKCSATDCERLGILNVDDNFEYKDLQEQKQNTGVIEGVLNQKYIRFRNEWYKVVDIRKGNIVTGEPSNVIFTAEIVDDLEQAVNQGSFGVSGGELQIIESAEKYKVYVDDSVYGEYESGANVVLSPAPKTSYRFKGFESYDVTIINNSFTMPDNDVYIISIYAPLFTVTIDNEIFGNFEAGETVNIDAGTKEGFDFTLWTGNINVENSAQSKTSFIMPEYAVELKTNWSAVINTWTVTVTGTMDMDGTYNVTKGESIKLISGYQNQYDFSRWNILSGSGAGDLNQNSTDFTPNEDTSISCIWQFNNKWLVSYSGIDKESEYVLAGTTVYLSAPSLAEYDFNEWTSSYPVTFSAPNSQYSSFTMPQKDITITAHYNIKTYTITFYVDDVVYDTVTVNYGGTVNKPTDPSKQYYTFNEWQDAQGNTIDFSAQIYEDKNYYADFTHIKYTVTFNANGGTNVDSVEIFGGESIGTLPTTTKEGYLLTGWFIGDTQISENYIVTSNVEVVAQWEDEPEFDEVAMIDLNTTADLYICRHTDMYSLTEYGKDYYALSDKKNVSNLKFVKIPMYIGTWGFNNGFRVNGSNIPDECKTAWVNPPDEPHAPHFLYTANKPNATTYLVTYSKWVYSDEDEEHELVPTNPVGEISGDYYFAVISIAAAYQSEYGKSYVNAASEPILILADVKSIGRGWYRYEWIYTNNTTWKPIAVSESTLRQNATTTLPVDPTN